ncbi:MULTISPECIES: hypothetical protein [Haloferax]|uniref:Uncharacterized protein n=1 Tax=Haloferax marinum TaxID=2666143 RepID=A0A6A8GEX1_9EURY|nr:MULTISPECIES: hypothetical protein [Haloferax]KAB1190784.1 hypothetical protein Hfx1150_17295 [Haloferax sp. CBA1150]MRW98326.1 hypothetical protein [Haloferax marinum]
MRCEDTTNEHGSIEVETLVCETETECEVGPEDQVAHDVIVTNYKRNKAYLDIEVRSSDDRIEYKHGSESRVEKRNLLVRPRTSSGPGRREERFWLRRASDATPGNDILEVAVRYALLPDTEAKNTSVPDTFPEVTIR